jgi:hypothetical protein
VEVFVEPLAFETGDRKISSAMTISEALDRGRESFARHAWGDAYACLSAADRDTPLQGEDLERLAYAAYLTGRDADSEGVLTRTHQAFLSRGDAEGAARCAFWLAFALLNQRRLREGRRVDRARAARSRRTVRVRRAWLSPHAGRSTPCHGR